MQTFFFSCQHKAEPRVCVPLETRARKTPLWQSSRSFLVIPSRQCAPPAAACRVSSSCKWALGDWGVGRGQLLDGRVLRGGEMLTNFLRIHHVPRRECGPAVIVVVLKLCAHKDKSQRRGGKITYCKISCTTASSLLWRIPPIWSSHRWPPGGRPAAQSCVHHLGRQYTCDEKRRAAGPVVLEYQASSPPQAPAAPFCFPLNRQKLPLMRRASISSARRLEYSSATHPPCTRRGASNGAFSGQNVR